MPPKNWKKPNAKTDRIKFRLTFDEEVRITANAATAGMSVSEYVRDRALNGRIIERKGPPSVFDAEQMDELRQVGDEINALAKASNSGKDVDADAVNAAIYRLRKLLVQV